MLPPDIVELEPDELLGIVELLPMFEPVVEELVDVVEPVGDGIPEVPDVVAGIGAVLVVFDGVVAVVGGPTFSVRSVAAAEGVVDGV